jgi:bifunctional DNA-binding transcriptional regulator/antitoxin component of YhaV-PrlF toxin-antitoxin module
VGYKPYRWGGKLTALLVIGFSNLLWYNYGGISGILKRRVSIMTTTTTLQIRSKGTVTLPIEFRRKYGIDEGDVITLIDLGHGSFLLTPLVTQVDRLGDRVARAMVEAGVSEDELLAVLDEERERYYQERFVQS